MKITEVIRHKDINENPDSITNYNNLFRYRDVINWNDKGSYGFGYVDGEMFVTDEGKTHDSVRDDKGRKLRRAHYEYAGRIWTFDKIISFWQYPPPDMIHKVIGDLRKKLHVNVNNTYKIETLPNKVTDIDRFKGNRDWDKAYHDEIGKPVFLTPTEYSKLSNVKQLSPADRAKQHSLSPMLKGKRQGTPKIPIPIQQKYKQTAEGNINNVLQIIKEEISNMLNENVQQMEKKFVKTGIFNDEDKKNVLEITRGDNHTFIIAKIYAWFMGIGGYTNHASRRPNDEFNSRYKKLLFEYYLQLKNYDKNVFPIKNLNINNDELHPLEIASALNDRNDVINFMKKIPSIYQRNLRNEIRTPRDEREFQYPLIKNIRDISNQLKLIDRISDEKKEKIFKKVFSSNNTTFAQIRDQLMKMNINYLSHEDAIEEVKDKIDFEADTGEAELLYENGNVLVVDVKSGDAMKNLGCGSQWCFAIEHGEDHWHNYADNSHVNIVYNFNEEGDSPLRMVVILPHGSTYNMYNEYMDGEENMDELEGSEYLRSIGADDYINAMDSEHVEIEQ